MTVFRILHVDDDSDIREVVGICLALDSDFKTRSCSTGQEALKLVAEWYPAIVLLDVMMPGMDGPTTLAMLRENKNTAAVPVVFMTARAQTHELNHFHSLGAVGVIPKPFDPMTLAAIVRTYLQPTDDILHKQRAVFLRRIDDDVASLGRLKSTLRGEETPAAMLAEIRCLAHGLAGAGGIYGFSGISEAAETLEDSILLELNGGGSVQQITGALNGLLARIDLDKNGHRGGVRPSA